MIAMLTIRGRAMRLLNGDRADLGTKLEDYVLNADHRQGRHKARVFEAVLGIKGAATVLSVWIVRRGEDFPRLATCYIV